MNLQGVEYVWDAFQLWRNLQKFCTHSLCGPARINYSKHEKGSITGEVLKVIFSHVNLSPPTQEALLNVKIKQLLLVFEMII